jgi:hypothetical protein
MPPESPGGSSRGRPQPWAVAPAATSTTRPCRCICQKVSTGLSRPCSGIRLPRWRGVVATGAVGLKAARLRVFRYDPAVARGVIPDAADVWPPRPISEIPADVRRVLPAVLLPTPVGRTIGHGRDGTQQRDRLDPEPWRCGPLTSGHLPAAAGLARCLVVAARRRRALR